MKIQIKIGGDEAIYEDEKNHFINDVSVVVKALVDGMVQGRTERPVGSDSENCTTVRTADGRILRVIRKDTDSAPSLSVADQVALSKNLNASIKSQGEV